MGFVKKIIKRTKQSRSLWGTTLICKCQLLQRRLNTVIIYFELTDFQVHVCFLACFTHANTVAEFLIRASFDVIFVGFLVA